MFRLAMRLLGPPRFQLDEALLSIPRRKVAALLMFLAVTAKTHSREVLTDLLFPRQCRARARADFRTTLSILKNSIGEQRLGIEGSTIYLAAGDDVWVDVHQFRAMVAAEDGFASAAQTVERTNRLIAAAELYRGDFLSGFYLKDSPQFDEWQFLEQESLRTSYSWVLERLVTALEKRAQYEKAVEYGRKWLALDPLEEAVHRQLMRMYAAAGHRGLALQQYEKCRSILKEELGEDPEQDTEELVEAIRSKRFFQHRSFRRREPPNNLPVEPLPFIGRETELSRFLDALDRDEVRILTLTGTGGTGKTRLAVEAAGRIIDRFEDGAFFVDLLRARTPVEVIPAIARVLGIREPVGHGTSLFEILRGYLRRKRMLLLLDNFEHVCQAADQVVHLVSTSPDLKVVVTSRERLHIGGEQELQVPPLAVPTSVDDHAAQSLLRVESVRLFAQRAAAANPHFSLTNENAAVVAEICRHLDGLPLAIELAASRLKILSPRELMEKLAHRLELLRESSRTRPVRHQTLCRAIDWSYSLLEEPEKKLFTNLCAFSGGSGLQAVEQVCGSSRPESEYDILDVLASLVDKSLVRQDLVGGESRFSMLETICEYARARFSESSGAREIRTRHAEYYLRLAVEAETELHGPQQLSWLEKLEREISNLHTALSWFLQAQEIGKAFQLAVSLKWFWYRYGHFSEGQRWLDRAIAAASPAVHPQLRAKALHAQGWMLFVQGNWSGARDLYHQSLQLFREHHDRAGEGSALSDLGVVERWLGDRSLGDRYCEQAVEIAREVGQALQISIALIWAYATTGGKFEGPPPRAELEEAVELSRGLQNLWGVSHGLNGLGDLLREMGRYKEARPRYEEALRGFQQLKDKWMTAWTLEGLGTTVSHLGDFCAAMKYLKEGMKLFHDLGDKGNTVLMLHRLAMVSRAHGHHRQAARLLGAYHSLHGALVGHAIASPDKDSEELKAIFSEYEQHYPEEWSAGQVMSLDQSGAYALGEPPASA
jgi:predicted ATPase/DNA-binding SARP family transcriptional activator